MTGVQTCALPIYDPDKIWARPAFMWNDDIEIDGNTVKRFELMEEIL